MPPRISVFPKCYFDDLCAGRMDYLQWLRDAKALGGEGIEHYDGFLAPLGPDARRARARGDGGDGAGVVAAVLLARLHASRRRRTRAAGAAAEGRHRHVGGARAAALPHAEWPAAAGHDACRGRAADGRGHPRVARVRRRARRGARAWRTTTRTATGRTRSSRRPRTCSSRSSSRSITRTSACSTTRPTPSSAATIR